MPLQTQNFLGMPIQKNDYSGISGGLSNYLKGYESGMAPEKLEEEAKKRRLEGALKELELENKPEDYETQFDLRRAQSKHYRDQAAGRTFAPSSLGKLIQERNDLAAKNPDDPLIAEYDRAIKANGGKKFAPTGLGKLYTELQEVEEGFLPGSNGQIPLNADEQEELRNRYKLQIQKTTTDSGVRKSVLQGQNLLKSINASNIDDLTRYSGPSGAIKLKKDQAKDLMGKPSEEYLKYLEALQAVQLEAKELRQFFGDSITPAAADAIYEMVNATKLTRSPEAAKRMIQKSRDTIKKQVKTFEDSLNNISAYTGGNQQPQAPQAPQTGGKLFGSLQLEDDGSQ